MRSPPSSHLTERMYVTHMCVCECKEGDSQGGRSSLSLCVWMCLCVSVIVGVQVFPSGWKYGCPLDATYLHFLILPQ